jgi:hypothetical protein
MVGSEMRARSAKNSGSFMSETGLDLFRTGNATVDHFNERSKQLQAIRVLHKHDALDLLEMLMAPLSDVDRWSTGRRK